MDINWDAVGATAELLGALAVIVTLIYLARQINQNTSTVRSAAASAQTQAQQTLNVLLAQDGEVNRLFWAGLEDREALDVHAQRRFDAIFAIQVAVLQQSSSMSAAGSLEASDVTENELAVGYFATLPGFRSYWSQWGRMQGAEFRDLVDAAIRRAEANAE